MTVRAHLRHRAAGPDRRDWLFTAAVAAVSVCLALFAEDGRRPDLLGWVLLGLVVLTLAWRRRYPLGVLLAMLAAEAPYHALDNAHAAATVATMVATYSLAVAGPRKRTLIVIPTLMAGTMTMMMFVNPDKGADMFRTAGWLLLAPLLGEAVRVHRNYIAAIVERAERAERTREEVAARRVAEERLRIARDLHDLLAHSITVIGVQTSVAAHVLVADPDRLDRTALASSLDAIADTCRDARAELRTTLKVLRTGEYPDAATGPQAGGALPVPETVGAGPSPAGPSPGPVGSAPERGPLPGLPGLSDLAEAARAAGLKVELAWDGAASDTAGPEPASGPDGAAPDTATGPAAAAPQATAAGPPRRPVPPAVGAAAYRIVQQSLTNAVQHAGPGASIRVELSRADQALHLSVTDSGPAAAHQEAPRPPTPSPGGYGIPGMRERARSVGGRLAAGPRGDGKPGFTVTAELPLEAM
ncbi:sensor histidine kinase [Streptomyces coryli]|uniref:sensor histidine kinase n=1 Tax=Streptomyces coryli TaxID=1128680 RepID=UPI003B83562C